MIRIQDEKGRRMPACPEGRARWLLDTGRAEAVSQNPLELRLRRRKDRKVAMRGVPLTDPDGRIRIYPSAVGGWGLPLTHPRNLWAWLAALLWLPLPYVRIAPLAAAGSGFVVMVTVAVFTARFPAPADVATRPDTAPKVIAGNDLIRPAPGERRPRHWNFTAVNKWRQMADEEAFNWLARSIFFEARGEPIAGQIAVAMTIFNRVQNHRFPDSVPAVVRQHKQFSWYQDGYSNRPTDHDPQVWRETLRLTRALVHSPVQDPTNGALFYHADYVDPRWSDRLDRLATIGQHHFYAGRGG
jgi:hypothetical protein